MKIHETMCPECDGVGHIKYEIEPDCEIMFLEETRYDFCDECGGSGVVLVVRNQGIKTQNVLGRYLQQRNDLARDFRNDLIALYHQFCEELTDAT